MNVASGLAWTGDSPASTAQKSAEASLIERLSESDIRSHLTPENGSHFDTVGMLGSG
jgi:hypothetical protein